MPIYNIRYSSEQAYLVTVRASSQKRARQLADAAMADDPTAYETPSPDYEFHSIRVDGPDTDGHVDIDEATWED